MYTQLSVTIRTLSWSCEANRSVLNYLDLYQHILRVLTYKDSLDAQRHFTTKQQGGGFKRGAQLYMRSLKNAKPLSVHIQKRLLILHDWYFRPPILVEASSPWQCYSSWPRAPSSHNCVQPRVVKLVLFPPERTSWGETTFLKDLSH